MFKHNFDTCDIKTLTFMCNMCVRIDLWMVGFHRVSHSNQDTQASIESYHEALKNWFSFDTIGLNRHHIH